MLQNQCNLYGIYNPDQLKIIILNSNIMKKIAAIAATGLLLLLTNCTKKEQEKEEKTVFPATTALQKDTIVNKEYVPKFNR